MVTDIVRFFTVDPVGQAILRAVIILLECLAVTVPLLVADAHTLRST